MAKTKENLQEGFAGESMANRKYLAWGKKAEEDGFPQVAKLFRAVAEAETIHAHNHFRAMGAIGTTAENLQAAIGGEHYEANTMYPNFLKEAKDEGENKAAKSFEWAMEVEKGHEVLYQEAAANLGKETESYDYYLCPVCGYTHPRNAPDKCPICGIPKDRFFVVK